LEYDDDRCGDENRKGAVYDELRRWTHDQSHMDQRRRTDGSQQRFDFKERVVVDTDPFNLWEPSAECNVTTVQMTELSGLMESKATNGAAMDTKVATTITRAASGLARWHDVLFFKGFDLEQLPPGVDPGPSAESNRQPTSLREAAVQAEGELGAGHGPISITAPLNENLVAATFDAVLELEARGYFATYHMVLGQTLWEELHRPTPGSLVLPMDRIKDTLDTLMKGGMFFRTTTLPANEALIVSMDGATIENVIAGTDLEYPNFYSVPETNGKRKQTIYHARIRECFGPRVRESHAVVRLLADSGTGK